MAAMCWSQGRVVSGFLAVVGPTLLEKQRPGF